MKNLLLIFLFSSSFLGFSQVGGEKVYLFLNLPTSARQIALGGAANTIEGDVNIPMWNAAMIDSTMENQFSTNYTSYLAGISLGSVSFVTDINDMLGMFYGGVQYLDYGSFIRADEDGTITGDFRAYDLALNIGYAYPIISRNITLGANVKFINSLIDTYSSVGIAADLSVVLRSSNNRTLYSMVFRNMGTQLKSYDGTKEFLPFQVTFGVSSSLEHLPLKWYFNIEDLQQWNVTVSNPSNETIDIEGDRISEEISFLDNATRHMVFGFELFHDKKITLRGGYNFRRAKELSINDVSGSTGFSYGFGINLQNLHFNYAMTKLHPGANASTFSLVVDLK
tara:strand:- start:7717 stop:8730 length:1014 start_codon:yes stop_codon:yes gene_type:complete